MSIQMWENRAIDTDDNIQKWENINSTLLKKSFKTVQLFFYDNITIKTCLKTTYKLFKPFFAPPQQEYIHSALLKKQPLKWAQKKLLDDLIPFKSSNYSQNRS